MKTICAKHERAYETAEGCPYCEPQITVTAYDHVFCEPPAITEKKNELLARMSSAYEQSLGTVRATPRYYPSRDAWWNASGNSIPKGFELTSNPQLNQDADVWQLACPDCKIACVIVVTGLETLQNSNSGKLLDLIINRRDAALLAMRNDGCTHAVMPEAT